MGTTSILQAAYQAVSNNEVGGNSSIADSIRPPLSSGSSGWTIGFNQQDFNTNPTQAQATLEDALVASGDFDVTEADDIGSILTMLGTSGNANTLESYLAVDDVDDIDGDPASFDSINAALQTDTAAESISQSSLNDFTSAFQTLQSNVFQSTSLLSSVQSALTDSTYGALLKIVLADYNNQYGGISSSGQMMQLLTTGSTSINGNDLTLDTASAATVTESVMTLVLDTKWVAQGNGSVACVRLSNDVTQAEVYDESQGTSLPDSDITIPSDYGVCTITPPNAVDDEASFVGDDEDGSFSGTSPENGVASISLSGTNNVSDLNNAMISLAADAVTTVAGEANAIAAAAGDALTVNGPSNTVNISGAGASVGAGTVTMVGLLEQLAFGTIEAVVTQGTQTSITGTDGTMTANNESGGTAIENVINWNTSGSQEQLLSGLSSGVSEEIVNYLGANLTSTLVNGIADFTNGTSTDDILSGLGSGISSELQNYTGLNATGALTQQTTDFTSGNSQFEAWNPSGNISTEFEEFSGTNDTGTNTENIFNWTAGGSQEELLSGLPSGVTEEIDNYAGANLTSTLINGIADYTNGTSTDDILSGLGSGISSVYQDYTGLNASGNLTQETWDYTAGNSQYEVWNPANNVAERFEEFSGLNDTGTDTENILDFTNGFSQEQLYNGMPSGVSSEYDDYTGANLTGTLLNGIVNYSAGTSLEIVVGGLPSNISEEYDYYNEVGAAGLESRATANLTNGETMEITYEYSGNTLEGSTADFYSGSTEIGTAVYYANGAYGTGDGSGAFAHDGDAADIGDGETDGGSGGYDGGYNGGYELTKTVKATGTNIGVIAQADASLSPSSATAAENAEFGISALSQLLSTGATNLDTPFFEGAKWNSNVVTWSLATGPGTTGSPFSGYMGTQYEALVQQAFQAWGAASGLTFEQVADSSNSDIRLGWGDFDTASSGVVGYTSYQDQNGQMDSNLIIRLEDPSQDSLVAATGGALTYSGTQASLYQVILHEIGHALGLSDNVDPNSVMYYQANGNPGTLDSNDIEGMQMLYGGATPSFATPSSVPAELAASEASVNSMLQQMIQAAAAFNAQQAALTSNAPPTTAYVPPELVAPPTLTPAALH
jgi:hypothetical protein